MKIEVVNTDGRVLRIIPIKPERRSIRTEDLKACYEAASVCSSVCRATSSVSRSRVVGDISSTCRRGRVRLAVRYKNEALGLDYDAAVARAETVLLPAFDSWRSGGASDAPASAVAAPGTLDWVFAEYRADRRFTKLDKRTKRNHEVGFNLVGNYQLKDGRRLGQVRLALITTAITDAVYEKLLVVTETDASGNVIERERRTTVNHAMKTCRRAWNVAARRNPGKLPLVNPFAKMGLRSSDRETPTATYEELQKLPRQGDRTGLSRRSPLPHCWRGNGCNARKTSSAPST